MNADELLKRVISHGADENGIRDRFSDNTELYDTCFREFIDDPNFGKLFTAIENKDYNLAFDAAHALKGISGNLGVTGFYTDVCALVEELRAHRYDDLAPLLSSVRRQHDGLCRLISDDVAPLSSDEGLERENTPDAGSIVGKKRMDLFAPVSVIVICAALLVIIFIFYKMSVSLRSNIMTESGRHLIEMSNQIELYIEAEVENDWRIAYSVADSITDGRYTAGDDDVFRMLRTRRDIWGIHDLMLYTKDGYCVNSDGKASPNDVASDTIDRARRLGQYMSILDSRIVYTVPMDAALTLNGSEIAAISVVRDMKTFLDDMDFSSFNDEAWMYLTDENGVVISMLTNKNSVPSFNFNSVISEMSVTPLDGGTRATMLTSTSSNAFLLSGDTEDIYVVSAPIETGDKSLRLLFLAPEALVNSTMSEFSRQLTLFSIVIILFFAVFAFFVFSGLYKNRKRMFDKALLARERMFDLLVNNTRTAFSLFTVNRKEPSYVSGNTVNVVGDRYWALDKTPDGYRMRNSADTETEVMLEANEMLRGWDGKTPFKSGYIRSDVSALPEYFSFQLYPTDDSGDNFVGITQDVTEAYQREQAVRNAMDMATRSNEAKSRFLSHMSHDIRTPMNAIVNMSVFALENIDRPKKLGEYLRTINDSSRHLLHLINEVLDMSRIESGTTAVSSESFDILTEVKKQAEMIKPLCDAKGLALMTDFSGLSADHVSGDALKLSQIIMNLLSNAVKFTPGGGAVRFTAREIPSLRSDMTDVRFTVEDNGIGISEKDMQHVFEPFGRADDRRVDSIEGTGLGLSICRSYVEAMGGTIRCESEKNEGSTFTVELFFKKSDVVSDESSIANELGESPFLGMCCLVAEDNATNRVIAKMLLERAGFMVDFAFDGGECVKKFLDARTNAYDVIYMDIQMPVLDGCEATISIRESVHPRAKTVPIVAMTANVFAEDIEKARFAGMDAYIGKPIMSGELIEQTKKALNARKGI